MTPPTAEEYEIWLEQPTTRFVLAGCQRVADLQAEAFKEAAWHGNLNPVDHARCKALANAYTDLATLSYEDALGANGLGPDGKDLVA